MKLLRYGDAGQEAWGLLDQDGKIRMLDDRLAEIAGPALSPAWFAEIGRTPVEALPLLMAERRIGPCIPRPLNFVCIGLNYADHAAETGGKIPKEPIVFLKSLSAFSGPYDDILIPRGSQKTDWEVELGVVIGTTARYVSEDEAMDHVAGFCTVNDISEREYQMERAGTWDKGKGCDTFGPVGPWLVTPDEAGDPHNLDLYTEVDGTRMQDGNTGTMVYGVKKLVSYVSHFITLQPGDIIATGTPPGVGLGKKPEPIFLKPGNHVKCGVQGLGEQSYKVVSA
jgi:2-keto-4-pentenoate hydratase/2-oxohepta-3-ene-1,7-dioic acid hydratase in catechol pathway